MISDLVLYGCATMPEADGVTVGGAIDFSKRVEFNGTLLSPTTQFQAVSSASADTGVKVQISYRDSTGVIQTPAVATLTGTTKVTLTTTAAERLLAGVTTGGSIAGLSNPGGTTATGDVAVMSQTLVTTGTMQGSAANGTTSIPPIATLAAGAASLVVAGMVLRTTGGTGSQQIRRILAVGTAVSGSSGADVIAINRNWGTIPDNTTTYEVGYGFVFELNASSQGSNLGGGTSTQCKAITRLFVGATANAAGGTTIEFYDKMFINNNNLATALTSAAILIQAIAPSLPTNVTINIALANALNDSTTITNRQTAPASATAFTSGSPPQSVSVPAPGNLAASTGNGSPTSSQAIWINLHVPGGSAAWEGVPTIRASGTTT